MPCCNEYGYCRPEAEWLAGQFRDCNGLSNGINLPEVNIKIISTIYLQYIYDLPQDVLKLEAFYTAIEQGVVSSPGGPALLRDFLSPTSAAAATGEAREAVPLTTTTTTTTVTPKIIEVTAS